MSPNPPAQNPASPSDLQSTLTSSNPFPFPHQDPTEPPSAGSRFNSFALPQYRNPHSGGPDTPVSTPQNQFNPFSLSTPNVAESSLRHLSASSSTAAPHHLQQHSSSQPLPPKPLTPSSSSFVGSTAKTAGGGGGGGSSSEGSGVPNLSLGQIHLLIATINDRNYETKRKEIQRVSPVFSCWLRAHIFSSMLLRLDSVNV
jgi:hypothetical protein